ncbi:AEC family transporter [Clostridium formicaceticum]|uniref:Malate transporter n=1 Tax=Clostridium formicaceticum TaxID=1497 RepID=A0AAC9WEQ8_9CLOT|nr:AEC family transporter [Clostridium formicaceticum]AOY75680.1 malate transporter [Clostridium formicaceticum]ARE85996.1 Membrane transport protein [Clostridium formicaceticum]
MVIFTAIQSILSIIILILIGYILTKIGWFDESTSKLFSRMVTTISLPALMIYNFTTSFTKGMLLDSAIGLLIPFLSIFICFLISVVFSHFFVQPNRRGTFETMFTVSNTVFIGIPVNIALFGEISVPYALLYFVANTLFFWTIGIMKISHDGGEGKKKIFSKETAKSILSPPCMGFFVGVLLVLLEIRLPSFIVDTSRYLGNLTTPLSLLFIGMTFHSIDIRKLSFSIDQLLLFLGRFLIAPLVVYLLAIFFPIPPLMFKVFIIQSAMPVMAQVAIVSKAYGGDYEYATLMVTFTTLASALIIPLYMVLLSRI